MLWFGYRLIQTLNHFFCKDYIGKAQANAESAGVVDRKPKSFPYKSDYYAEYNNNLFDTVKPSGCFWDSNQQTCPRLPEFIASFKRIQ